MEHTYLESGWCTCGHHRDDGRNERDRIELPTLDEIRATLGPTYRPGEPTVQTEAQTTKTATDALTDLVNTARARAVDASAIGDTAKMTSLLSIANTLDGARTRLVEDGTEYLDAAWAFVDAGRKQIADLYGAPSLLALVRAESAGRRRRG